MAARNKALLTRVRASKLEILERQKDVPKRNKNPLSATFDIRY
jgi:hypothetical protein